MYIHVVLFIFLICMLVLALDQAQTDVITAENQRDLQATHPGERANVLHGQRNVKKEQQKLYLNKLISIPTSENHDDIDDEKAGCSSFNAASSDDLLNKNYIKLNNPYKIEEITVLNYVRNNDWNKLPVGSNKPGRNKVSLNSLLNNKNEFNDITNDDNISFEPNFDNISDKNDEKKFLKVLIKDSSDSTVYELPQGSSTVLFQKECVANKNGINSSDSVDTFNDGESEKGLYKAATKSSANELCHEEKVIETQMLSKQDSDNIENLTNDVKKNSGILQKLLDYRNGHYKIDNSECVENKGIVPYKENIINEQELPETKLKNLSSSNYYTGGIGSKKYFNALNYRLYILPVILPESYLSNLRLINTSSYNCLMKSLENSIPKDQLMKWDRQRTGEETTHRQKFTETINYNENDDSVLTLVKNTRPLGERSNKKMKKYKNKINFNTPMPVNTCPDGEKNDTELKINLLKGKELKHDMIKNISFNEIATKSRTDCEMLTDYIDDSNSLEKDHFAVTPGLNTMNVNKEAVNTDMIKMMNEVLKLITESKIESNNNFHKSKSKNHNVNLLAVSKNSLDLGEQNYDMPGNQNVVEINTESRKFDNHKSNPSLKIEEIVAHEEDKKNDLAENDQYYYNDDDILSSNLHETPNVESLILKYENVPKLPTINSENTEGGDVKLVGSSDPEKYENNNTTNYTIDEHKIKSSDVESNDMKIDSLVEKSDEEICAVDCQNQPVVKNFNSVLQKRSCSSTSNDSNLNCQNNVNEIIIDANLHHEPIKAENCNKILNDIYHYDNDNSNRESPAENSNINLQTDSGDIPTLMKKLSPTHHSSPSLGKICVRGPENLIPKKVDIVFPGLAKTVLTEVQPRNIHFQLKNDPETYKSNTQNKSCFNGNEQTTSKSSKILKVIDNHKVILEQLRRMNETLIKLREDVNNGLFDRHKSTKNNKL